ncbi:MAG TPA: V4R domain-containing protein [Nitrososphaerales archaeon]|nr:V4R domain-containing protein [Nitrososphaerales archaeon]
MAGRRVLNGGKKRIFPVHYDPGKKLFHTVVVLSDTPGSFSSILELLSTKVNLIGTGTYTRSDGTALFSGFSEALSPKVSREDLKKLIMSSKAAISAEVYEGKDGLLVDTFHTGLLVGKDEYILMRREGLVHVFDRVTKLLGSGGDSLLFEEGATMGAKNAEIMIKNIGIDRVKNQTEALNRFLAAQGWGEVVGKKGPGKDSVVVVIKDCFECSADRGTRKACNFMRGYLAGSAQATYGMEFDSKETRCMLKGAEACEFVFAPKK